MKVRICYTVDVDENFRRALRYRLGRKGLATREEVRNWIMAHGTQDDDDLQDEYEQHLAEQREEERPYDSHY